VSYVLTSDHVEPLHDGRMVGPGDVVSEADAKKNPRLIERGVLIKEPEKSKPRAEKAEHGHKAEHKPAEQENTEESK
jgi:hypothetical protein